LEFVRFIFLAIEDDKFRVFDAINAIAPKVFQYQAEQYIFVEAFPASDPIKNGSDRSQSAVGRQFDV